MVTLTQSYVVCVLKDFISLSPSDASLYAADIWLESLRWVQVSFTSASQAVGRVSAGSDLLKEERRCISSCQMRTWIQDMLYKQGCFELNANSSMLTCWCSAGVMLLSVPDTWCADSALPLRVLTHSHLDLLVSSSSVITADGDLWQISVLFTHSDSGSDLKRSQSVLESKLSFYYKTGSVKSPHL